MADGELSRQVPPRVLAHPRDARRQGLRLDLGPAHEGLGPACLDDRSPLRTRLRTPRPQPVEDQALHRALPLAAPAGRAAEPRAVTLALVGGQRRGAPGSPPPCD